MKKALIIALVVVMALSVVGLVSCAGTTYQGEYSYTSWGQVYGCKVNVTVQGNVITGVEIREEEMEEAGWHNLSPNWTNNPYAGAIEGEAGVDTEGKTNWRKYGQAMVDSFVGLTVEEVLGIKVYVDTAGQPLTGKSNVETIKYIPDQLAVVIGGHTVGEDVEIAKDAGATQSTGRLILAVQNALLNGEENENCVTIDLGKDSTAYGLVHGKGYVGQGTVTVKYGKVVAASLNEACLPTYVTAKTELGAAAEADGTYLVSGKAVNHGSTVTSTYYKTVKFADIVMTYDTTEVDGVSKGYMVGTKTMLEFFADEANCQKWFEAVAGDKVAVVTAEGDKTDVMNAKALLKTQNGYWGSPAAAALGWTANVDATCKYVVANGFDGVTAKEDLKQADHSATSPKLDNEWTDKNGVATGATWTDMWDYVNLLHNAFNKTAK